MTWAVGVDLGGTKLEVALVDAKGSIGERLRVDTKVKEGPSVIIGDIVDCVNRLKSTINENILGVGVGIAGQIEPTTGEVLFAPNLKWHDVPLQSQLIQSLNMPVFVTNDVRAATWGEWLHGSGKGIEDLLCIFIGTGIGGGIVSGGRLLVGSSNAAGEIGHMPINFHGPICGCGNHGCFEAFAGGWAIARRAKELISQNPSKGAALIELAKGHIDLVSAKTVFEAARAGVPLAREIVEETIEAMVAGVSGLVNAFNPRCVVLGGGIIQGHPESVARIREGVFKCALKASLKQLQIVECKLLGDAGVVGAASMAIHSNDRR